MEMNLINLEDIIKDGKKVFIIQGDNTYYLNMYKFKEEYNNDTIDDIADFLFEHVQVDRITMHIDENNPVNDSYIEVEIKPWNFNKNLAEIILKKINSDLHCWDFVNAEYSRMLYTIACGEELDWMDILPAGYVTVVNNRIKIGG